MEAIKKFWSETMEIPGAGWIIGFGGLIVGLLVGYYVLGLLRNMALGKTEDPTNYISDFQRLRDEGKLDDEEYKKLTQAIPKTGIPKTGIPKTAIPKTAIPKTGIPEIEGQSKGSE